MIIKRPSIFIYVNNPDAVFLRDVCAGIEEEGVFYEIKEMETALPDAVSYTHLDVYKRQKLHASALTL